MTKRHLRSVPGTRDPATQPPPPPSAPDATRDRGDALSTPVPTLALLRARADADIEGLVSAVVRVMRERGERPALLWLERTDALERGVFTVAQVPDLFPEPLRDAARAATVARIAHVGPGALAEAFAALVRELAPPADRIVMDGRFLAVARAHVAAVVTGDEIGPMLESAQALRPLCDVEVFEPSDAIATALALALARRAAGG